MGCLRRIFSIVILILAFIGFQSIGGIEFCKDKIDKFLNPGKSVVLQEAREIADFSKVPEEYNIMRTLNFMGVKLAVATHRAHGQKCVFIDTKGTIKVNKTDFYSNKIEDILANAIRKFAYQAIRVEHPKVVSSGAFQGLDQEIPYVIFESDVIGIDSDKMYGMLGVAQAPDGENDLVLSFSLDKHYDQFVAEDFFKNISYSRKRDL